MTEYDKIRYSLIQKLMTCFSIDELTKKLDVPEADKQGVRDQFLSLQEASFTLIIETLCVVSGDKFSKVNFLFYTPSMQLLNSLQNYLIKLDGLSSPSSENQLLNSDSKKIVEGLKKSRFLEQDDQNEDDSDKEDEELEISETKDMNEGRKKVCEQSGEDKHDERLQFVSSLIAKLLMQCPKILLSEFGFNLIVFFAKSPRETMSSLLKVILRRMRAQDLDESDGVLKNLYWKFIDGVILKIYQEERLDKSCELAKLAAKIYF